MKTIGVVGAGTMGSGIAQVAAVSGFNVLMHDSFDGTVARAKDRIAGRLQRAVDRNQMSETERDQALSLLRESAVKDFSRADFIIEAVVEVMPVKQAVFTALDEAARPDVILATNTSSFSITELAHCTHRPDRVLGMHFFNPAPVMKLIELVRGEDTSDQTVEMAEEISRVLGKETIVVQKDTPGFVVNRILMPLFIEAMRILEEGVATKEDIDKAVKLGLNHPMGPLTLADFTGLDVDLEVMDYLYDEFHDDRFAAPQVLRRLVRSGRLGKKNGRGFYQY
jgi:3-hydroxybutyryl-CoA dehydrogenase